MAKIKTNLRKVATIVACLVVTTIFVSCGDKDNGDQIRIIITDIPSKYDGMLAQSSLSSPSDELVYASGGIFEDGITNGKATIYYNYSNYVGRPFDKKGEYIVTFQIREDIVKGHPPVSVFHWGGERLINITKTTTSISFNTLKVDDKQTYPFTVGGDD